jgi:cytochrome c
MRPATVLLAVIAGGVLVPAVGRSEPGAKMFKARCAPCHGESGAADTPQARALKVPPLIHDHRLSCMSVPDIVQLVKSDPKHRGVVKLEDAHLEAAAAFVKHLAKQRYPCE